MKPNIEHQKLLENIRKNKETGKKLFPNEKFKNATSIKLNNKGMGDILPGLTHW